jgi:hypothetical protein
MQHKGNWTLKQHAQCIKDRQALEKQIADLTARVESLEIPTQPADPIVDLMPPIPANLRPAAFTYEVNDGKIENVKLAEVTDVAQAADEQQSN